MTEDNQTSNQQPTDDNQEPETARERFERNPGQWLTDLLNRPSHRDRDASSEAGNRTETFTADYIPGGGSQSNE